MFNDLPPVSSHDVKAAPWQSKLSIPSVLVEVKMATWGKIWLPAVSKVQ